MSSQYNSGIAHSNFWYARQRLVSICDSVIGVGSKGVCTLMIAILIVASPDVLRSGPGWVCPHGHGFSLFVLIVATPGLRPDLVGCALANMVFALDSSGSVGETTKRFVESVVQNLYIGPIHTQVGLVTFGTTARIQVNQGKIQVKQYRIQVNHDSQSATGKARKQTGIGIFDYGCCATLNFLRAYRKTTLHCNSHSINVA